MPNGLHVAGVNLYPQTQVCKKCSNFLFNQFKSVSKCYPFGLARNSHITGSLTVISSHPYLPSPSIVWWSWLTCSNQALGSPLGHQPTLFITEMPLVLAHMVLSDAGALLCLCHIWVLALQQAGRNWAQIQPFWEFLHCQLSVDLAPRHQWKPSDSWP